MAAATPTSSYVPLGQGATAPFSPPTGDPLGDLARHTLDRSTSSEALDPSALKEVRSFRCIPMLPDAQVQLALGDEIVWTSPDPHLRHGLFRVPAAREYTFYYTSPEGDTFQGTCTLPEGKVLKVNSRLVLCSPAISPEDQGDEDPGELAALLGHPEEDRVCTVM